MKLHSRPTSWRLAPWSLPWLAPLPRNPLRLRYRLGRLWGCWCRCWLGAQSTSSSRCQDSCCLSRTGSQRRRNRPKSQKKVRIIILIRIAPGISILQYICLRLVWHEIIELRLGHMLTFSVTQLLRPLINILRVADERLAPLTPFKLTGLNSILTPQSYDF